MRIAIWQTPSPAGDVATALSDLSRALQSAAAMGAVMLVTPEVFLPGYNQDDLPDLAQPSNGVWLDQVAGLCRRASCGVTLGYAERDGGLYNAAITLDAQGNQVAHFRKIQLYGPRENALYTPGDSYTVFTLHGVTCALLICYDIEFAPHVAELAARGVQLILCPTANMQPFTHVVRYTVSAMAANHGLTIAYANYCGSEGDLTYVGGPLIADPYGEPLVQAGLGPALLVADLPTTLDPARLSTQSTDYRKL
ncbi:MAG: carbon-nitrogen hydrolase family protein [Candidatus Saccharibacteria bacterium]|nr:carbon-nitrogen hydrolase family protein [Pseudorhodobacter sp.]